MLSSLGTYDFTDYSNLLTKVEETDAKVSELGLELGLSFVFDLNDSTNWHSGEINTSSGEEIIPSNFYIISDRFVLAETAKDIKVTNTNNRDNNTVVFCWDIKGEYLGFKASSGAANIATALEAFPSAYSFAIRLTGTDVSIINTDAIWDSISLSPLKHNGSSRLDTIETDIKSITDEIDKINKTVPLVESIKEIIENKQVVGKNKYNGTPLKGYISGSGVLTTNDSGNYYYSSKIEVEPNTYYYLYGRTLTSAACIAIEKTDGSTAKVLAAATGQERTVDFYLPNEQNTNQAINGQFLTPPESRYVYFNLYFASSPAFDTSFNDNIMLVRIGDSYNPNYDVGEYEEYNSEERKVVKSKALPIVDNLEDGGSDAILSAEQGKVLDRKISTLKSGGELKILLVGSSHGMNTISQFPWIAYKSGFNVTVGNVYKGSLTLQQVAASITNSTSIGGWFKVFEGGAWVSKNSTMFDDVITYTEWDYIIVQRSASDDDTWTDEQSAALDVIIEQIKKATTNNPTIVFNTGFADPDSSQTNQEEASNTIISSAKEMKSEYQLDIIPVATAIQNARNTSLGNLGNYYGSESKKNQLCYDSMHLDYGIGCYVAGATLFEFFFRKFGWSVLTAEGYGSYDEVKTFVDTLVDSGGDEGSSNAYTEPNSETMKIAKYCAIAAVNNMDVFSIKLAEKWPQVSRKKPL